jgi:TPP-dependent pyruvate/acetoin dehydrogenase alpha subunit
MAAWERRDPIELHRSHLLAGALATEDELQHVEADVEAEVADAVSFARSSPDPDPASAFTDVFAAPIEVIR